MEKTSDILKKALKGIMWEYAETDVSNIDFSPEVVKSCKMNYCGQYNKTWCCPPGVGELEDLKKKYNCYKKAFVFTTKHDIEDSFDIEGMFRASDEHLEVEKVAIEALTGRDYKMLGASGCKLCEKCTYPDAPCRFPQKARPSVEACGISVVNLAKDCKINYVNGPDTVTYFSVIFYNN